MRWFDWAGIGLGAAMLVSVPFLLEWGIGGYSLSGAGRAVRACTDLGGVAAWGPRDNPDRYWVKCEPREDGR